MRDEGPADGLHEKECKSFLVAPVTNKEALKNTDWLSEYVLRHFELRTFDVCVNPGRDIPLSFFHEPLHHFLSSAYSSVCD